MVTRTRWPTLLAQVGVQRAAWLDDEHRLRVEGEVAFLRFLVGGADAAGDGRPTAAPPTEIPSTTAAIRATSIMSRFIASFLRNESPCVRYCHRSASGVPATVRSTGDFRASTTADVRHAASYSYVFAGAAVNAPSTWGRKLGQSTMKVSIFSLWRAVALLAFVLCAAVPASAQGFKWWQDDTFRRELGLTQEQTTRLEAIFQKSLPTLRKQKDALDRAQAEFDRLVEGGDDGSVMDQVGVVEGARAELNKARTLMLLHMRRV